MGLTEALEFVARNTEHTALIPVVRDIEVRINKGGKFADALAAHPDVFNAFTVEVVRSGEANGVLVQSFHDLVVINQRKMEVASKIRRSIAYPFFLVVMSIVLLPLNTFVRGGILDYLGQIIAPLGVLSALVIVVLYCKRLLDTSDALAQQYETIVDAIPLLGAVQRKSATARFLRMFAVLIRGGVGAHAAMNTAAMGCGNSPLRQSLLTALPLLKKGLPISQALAETHSLPESALAMLASGEKSGEIEKSAEQTAEYYEKEADEQVALMSQLLPSVFLIIAGGYIAYKAYAFYAGLYANMDGF
jgi:type II secretory pathway component PulF